MDDRRRLKKKLQTEFLLIIVHQLRTPLSHIKWMIRSFLDGDIGPITREQRKLLEQSRESVENMSHSISDILDWASLEEGIFAYKFSSIVMADLIKRTMKDFFEEAKKKKIKLIFEEPIEFLSNVEIDETRIRLVLQNLLSNAIRYTPRGGQVTISIKLVKMNLIVAIKDTGIGISKSQQPKIFSKFFRADNAVQAQSEGSGLGLFISKNIIEKHGGKIWFESEENKGSTFYFKLPIKNIKP